MRVVASSIFHLMMFPHDGKIVKVEQFTYYDPQGLTTLEHVIPTIDTTIDNVYIPSLFSIGTCLFTGAFLNDTFLSL